MWMLAVDLVILLIVAFFVYRSYKKGLARTVLELAAFVVAIVAASFLSEMVSHWVYDAFIGDNMMKQIEVSLSESAQESIVEALPDYIVDGAKTLGIYDGIVESQRETISQTASALCLNVVKPVLISIIRIIASVVIFSLLTFVLHFVVRALDKIFKLPIIGGVNRALGAVLGLLKGSIVVFVLCFAISALMMLNGGSFWIFNKESIELTYLFRYIYSIRPF